MGNEEDLVQKLKQENSLLRYELEKIKKENEENAKRLEELQEQIIFSSLFADFPDFKDDYKALKDNGIIFVVPDKQHLYWAGTKTSLCEYFLSIKVNLKVSWQAIEKVFDTEKLEMNSKKAKGFSKDFVRIKAILKNKKVPPLQ